MLQPPMRWGQCRHGTYGPRLQANQLRCHASHHSYHTLSYSYGYHSDFLKAYGYCCFLAAINKQEREKQHYGDFIVLILATEIFKLKISSISITKASIIRDSIQQDLYDLNYKTPLILKLERYVNLVEF